MSLINLLPDVDQVFFHPDFRNILEDHLELLKKTGVFVAVSEMEAYRYEHNFYKLLANKNVPFDYHWLILRMCGYHSPTDVGLEVKGYYVPDLQLLGKLREQFLATLG